MVRSINILTIRRYSLYKKTGNIKYLMWFPLPGFKKRVKKLIDDIDVRLNGKKEVEKLTREQFHKSKSVYRIYLLYVLFDALKAHYTYLGAVNHIREKAGMEPVENKYLSDYLDIVKKESGVDVKGFEDLDKIKDKIQHLEDKYDENFSGVDTDERGQTFDELVIMVFMILKMSIQYDLTISDFIIMKSQADEIAKVYGENQRDN